MARKEPKKDIRDDGRHIPLEHHTARGDVPRNSGNFTRGSQLLTTQVWMWSQGARLPLVMWLVLFAVCYFIILSVTLNENNVQLICMRSLARRTDDEHAEAKAHASVDKAKRALGERGPVWWDDVAPDLNRHMARTTPYAEWYAAQDETS